MIFQEGIKHAESVGDIKTSVRTDLGANWALCNGAVVNVENYPEASKLLNWSSWNDLTPNVSCYEPHVFGVGDTLAYVGKYTGGNTDYFQVCYALDGGATYNSFKSYQVKSSYIYPRGLYSYNGLWCMSALASSSPSIFYTTDITNKNSWTQYNLGTGDIQGIYCHEGTWVACGKDSTGVGCIWLLDNLTTGGDNFVQRTVGGSMCHKVFYHNGLWVVAGVTNVNKSGGTRTIQVYVTDDIRNGNFTENLVFDQTIQNTDCQIYGLYGYGGEWVITSVDQNYYTRIHYTDNPLGTWRSVYPTNSQNTSNRQSPSSVYCYQGTWYYFETQSMSGARVPYLRSTTDLFSEAWADESISGASTTPKSIFVNGNGVFTAGHDSSSSNYLQASKKSMVLPTISVTGAYAYMKMKE